MNVEDIDDLEAFVSRVERLVNCSVFSGGQAATFQVSASLSGPTTFSVTGPKDELIEAALAVLRPLLAQGGPTSLHHVFNLCHLHLNDADLLGHLSEVRGAWKKAQKEGVIKLVINDKHWRPEVVADLVVNGYFAHDDPPKRRRLRELGVVESMLTRTVFHAYFTDAANAAARTGSVVRVGLRDRRFK